MSLQDKVVVITGGAKGLGLEMTKAFHAAGAQVCILGRTENALQEAVDDVGDGTSAYRADVANPDDVRQAFQSISETYDAVDILINNAATIPLFSVEKASDQELRSALDTNLLGALHTIRSAIPLMRKRNGGLIVNVSSESVADPYPFLSAYAASKAGLEVLSNALRFELRPDNIRILNFRVGRMDTGDASRLGWDMERAAPFFEFMAQRGLIDSTAQPMCPAKVASTLVSLAEMPVDVGPELFVLREV